MVDSTVVGIVGPLFGAVALGLWCAIANCIRAQTQVRATSQLGERVSLLETKVQVIVEKPQPAQPKATAVPVPIYPATVYQAPSYYPPYSSAYQGQSLPVTR
jgi:hypothetical protein